MQAAFQPPQSILTLVNFREEETVMPQQRTTDRESVSYEVQDDTGMLFAVDRAKNGSLTATVRVCGRVDVEGKTYEYDRNIRVKLRKEKPS